MIFIVYLTILYIVNKMEANVIVLVLWSSMIYYWFNQSNNLISCFLQVRDFGNLYHNILKIHSVYWNFDECLSHRYAYYMNIIQVGSEAAFHSIEEYMEYVEEYYQRIEQVTPVEKRKVYLSTDDSKLYEEAIEKYCYLILFNNQYIIRQYCI